MLPQHAQSEVREWCQLLSAAEVQAVLIEAALACFQVKPVIPSVEVDKHFVERFDKEKSASDAGRLAATARQNRSLFFFPEGQLTRMPGLMNFENS